MPRRTAKQRKKERKIVAWLAGVVAVFVLAALAVVAPGFVAQLYRVLGITQVAKVPVTGLDSPVGVHIIDVGQGDAVLLQADGEFALIDAGPPEGTDYLLEYLRAAGVQTLRYVFMTHPHADHIGGMQAVVEAFPVGCVLLPDFGTSVPGQQEDAPAAVPTTSIFEGLLAAMLEKDVPAETAAEGTQYPLGSGTVQVVHAGLPGSENYNLLSLGLLFNAGGLRFLNTGDGEKANERAMLESGQQLGAQVFLAGHHGSSTSNTAAFVQAVQPAVVVVSCAAGNSYGHPHKSALAAFEEAGALVLRTDRHSTVLLQPDGAGGIVYATAQEE